MMLDILAFVRSLRDESATARPSDYKKGYRDALREVEEFITAFMWENGLDDPEDD